MMSSIGNILFFIFCVIAVSISEPDVRSVEPEELEKLLENGDYEEFSKLLRIDDVKLVIPKQEKLDIKSLSDNSDPMFHEGLPLGDILLPKEQVEEARSGVDFEKYPNSKWPNGVVPYSIARLGFGIVQRRIIENAINDYNTKNTGTRFVPRTNEKDYVMIFSGQGCYSYLGRIGEQQPLSLQRTGCVQHGIVQHEMIHAVGFTHEHNRPDRDNSVRVLWENIPREWHSQYEKGSAEDFVTTTDYDYYSVMHYGMNAPGTRRKAFEILRDGIDESQIGQRRRMTELDVQKIRNAYQ